MYQKNEKYTACRLWRSFRYLFTVLILSVSLAGCAGRTVPQNQVEKDIARDLRYLDVTSVEVVDRDTDSSRNLDRVYAEAEAENRFCRVTFDYVLEYYRYDNKWKLEDDDCWSTEFELLRTSATEEDAEEALRNSDSYSTLGWGEIILTDHFSSLDDFVDTFVFDIVRQNGYLTEHYVAEVTYRFDNFNWQEPQCTIRQDHVDSELTGEWSVRNGNANVWVNILSCDGNSCELEYEITSYYDTWYTHELKTVSSCGAVTVWAEDRYGSSEQMIRLPLGEGTDQNGEPADAGYLDIYPDEGPVWWGIGQGEFSLYPEVGDSEAFVPLNEMVADGYCLLDYMEEEITDPNQTAHYGYFDLRSANTVLGHFAKTLTYQLNGEFSTFSGTYFPKPDMQADNSIVFIVYFDGEQVYTSDDLTRNSPAESFVLDVTGVNELTIRGYSLDHENDGPSPGVCLTEAELWY